jgi:hypothetical protein
MLPPNVNHLSNHYQLLFALYYLAQENIFRTFLIIQMDPSDLAIQ